MSAKELHNAFENDSCTTEGEEEWNLKRKMNNDNMKMVSSADGGLLFYIFFIKPIH